ncbi:hypothetical protein R3W88_029540 [Solanum pinnatisectum]|uniref:Uncharacterized protein n=1 Tax=Solanum pinnatisectum TaxID=50273 RepID=A0AAV9K7D4_9SOLN|nr:hypothetical protein R3W88_029540 [Solanum pinnatisectum]
MEWLRTRGLSFLTQRRQKILCDSSHISLTNISRTKLPLLTKSHNTIHGDLILVHYWCTTPVLLAHQCVINGNICSMIIDSKSGTNVVSSYVWRWLNDFNEIKVTKQCMISFSIGRYYDNVLCDVIPMQDCHIMLGWPW